MVYIIVGLQPADATQYEISASILIPEIGLESDVTSLVNNNGELDTPDTIVGSYTQANNKTLLIGHSTTVFENLHQIQVGDQIIYNDTVYSVISRYIDAKEDISMDELLRPESEDTIVLMTCAGELLNGGDATHRLIVVAVKN